MNFRQKEKRTNQPRKSSLCSNEQLDYITSRSKMQIW